jgi:predicted TPR repeat methyltransferase
MLRRTAGGRKLCLDENPCETARRLTGEGRAAEAAALLNARLAEGRGGLLMRLELAHAETACGDKAAALATARETAHLYPDLAASALGLGEALMAAELVAGAIAEFQRALRIDPGLGEARFALGLAWLSAGEAERALQNFAQVVPETPGLAGKIHAAEAMLARPRSDEQYVRHLFDQFSADYDERMLSQLGYAAPRILRHLFDLTAPGAHDLSVLDLGCGTGLCGEAFRDVAVALDGIDLSPRMLEKAGSRGIYRSLTIADIETPVAGEAYNLALAADTLVYLGDLAGVFGAVHKALKSGGFFLFTVEKAVSGNFELGPKRRWRHSEDYLRGSAVGFEIAGLVACTPRCEKGEAVEGYAVALQKNGEGV